MTSTNHPPPNQRRKDQGIVYLACPYTDFDSAVREQRFRAATKAAAVLVRKGYVVYSPITMTHPIDVVPAGETKTLGSDYWVSFDEAFMNACAEMVVLTIDGWDKSRGIQREVAYFQSQGKSVRYMRPDGDLLYDLPGEVLSTEE